MIDFIKIRLDPSHSNTLLSNPLLDFKGEYSRVSGDVYTYPLIAKHENLIFEIKSEEFILLKGSIHKYWQNGRNHKDFYFYDLSSAIHDMCNKYKIDPNKAFLCNLEFGVNLQSIGIETSVLLNSILRYRKKSFHRMRNNKLFPVAGKDCYMTQFGIKAYDKAKQYSLDHQIFRFEIKVRKMEFLHKNKIYIFTLKELLKKSIINELGKLLTSKWEELLIFENDLYKANLKDRDRTKLRDYRHSGYWENLNKTSSKCHDYHRRKYKNMVMNLEDPQQKKISLMIDKKWKELSYMEEKYLAKLTNL